MTTPDYRALCAELADRLDYVTQCLLDDNRLTDPLSDHARALLAAPEAVGVADEELDQIYWNLKPAEIEHCWRVYARAVLSRYAHPAPVPVGDVRYEFSVYDGEDEWQAGGDASTIEKAQREGRRYLAQYSQDPGGPYRLELREVRTLPGEP